MAITIIRKPKPLPESSMPESQSDRPEAAMTTHHALTDLDARPAEATPVAREATAAATTTSNSWDVRSDKAPPPLRTLTLEAILTIIDGSDQASAKKRDMTWAIQAFARAAGRTPSDIVADAASIRALLSSMSPAMLGLQTGSFYNLKALLRKAMDLAGKPVHSRLRTFELIADWASLMESLPCRRARIRLAGFVSYLSSQGHVPTSITNAHIERYANVLQHNGIEGGSSKKIERTVQEWNLARETVPSWPKATLSVPWKPKKPFTPPLEDLPEGYQRSAAEYLAYLQNPPLDDDNAPLKGLRFGSIRTRLFLLRYMAAVLREAGWSDAELSSINCLVTPKALKVLLAHKRPEANGKYRAQYVVRFVVLKSIAKYRAGSPAAEVKHLSKVIGRHAVKSHEMAPGNRRKLQALRSNDVRARLFGMSAFAFKALDEVADKNLMPRHGAVALAAFYVELSLMWPGRVGTLSQTHLTDNIIRSGTGKTQRVFFHYLASQSKTGQSADWEAPPHLVALLERYLKRYRPLLIDEPSEYLFPAKNGGPRSPQTIYHAVTAITRRLVGMPINPHLFRHLTATMFLERRPHDYETVRRTLTHKSLDQAHQSYAYVDSAASVGRFDEVILEIRSSTPGSRPRRSKTTSCEGI
jgi:hypothetical protein